MALNFVSPTDYKITVNTFMTQMKTKNDYLKSWSSQPGTKSNKTPGDEIFNPSVFKGTKNQMNLSHYAEILKSTNLSEQERKFYNLQKFMIETANQDYQEVSDISTLFMENAQHIKELLSIKKNGKENKLIFLVPNSAKTKSNFWLSLFFIEITKSLLVPDFFIETTGRLDSSTYGVTSEFSKLFSSAFNYIVVITDDISYSGQQLSVNTFRSKIPSSVTIFFNLVGYSEIAKKRLNHEKDTSTSSCSIEFGRGAKYPLTKLSAKFSDANVGTNNVLYKKSIGDFQIASFKFGVRMLACLILNDVFYLKRGSNPNSLRFTSNLFSLYPYYETITKYENNNGSIQYLPIKYPDSYSTVENMCKFHRLQNVAILRIDRLIHHLNLPGQSDEQKLDYLSSKIIAKNLWKDSNGDNIYIYFKLIDLFINNSDRDFPILPNSFDTNFINMFTKTSETHEVNDLTNNILNKFNKNSDDINYNNSILNKFVSLNNKISKFNKKHMIEYVMPKSNYQFKQTAKYTIKNCKQFGAEPHQDIPTYCNTRCNLTFYKQINWD